MSAAPNPDSQINRVSKVVADSFTGHVSPDQHLQGRVRFLLALQNGSGGQHVRWLLGLAAACAAAAMLLMLLRPAPQAALVYRAEGLLREGDTWRSQPDQPTGRLVFSDGSHVAVQRGARARLERIDVRGADVALDEGAAQFSITPRNEANWRVFAGPYRVRVTGTVFTVDWQASAQRLRVVVLRGSVQVGGPGLPTPRSLRTGQSLTLGGVKDTAMPPAKTETDGPAEAPVVAPPAPTRQPNPKPDLPLPSNPWTQWVTQGRFQDVLDSAQARGLVRVLAKGSLADLAAVADAGRYAGKTDVARRALQAQVQRFPRSAHATMATFLLGRLADDQARSRAHTLEAISWYDRYLRLQPRGTFAEEASGRRMQALARLGDVNATRAAARAYLQQHPNGTFGDAARNLIGSGE